jgi:hypothetical protein
MPGSSILFHWSSCLFLCQYHAVFIAMALYYGLKSGFVIPRVVLVCSVLPWVFKVFCASVRMLGLIFQSLWGLSWGFWWGLHWRHSHFHINSAGPQAWVIFPFSDVLKFLSSMIYSLHWRGCLTLPLLNLLLGIFYRYCKWDCVPKFSHCSFVLPSFSPSYCEFSKSKI